MEHEATSLVRYLPYPGSDNDDAVCSDSECPCSETPIPRGTGYLYVPNAWVEFHQQMGELLGASGIPGTRLTIAFGPVLMCEVGAAKRGLDLVVAAADAQHWWKTAQVPLRATPTGRAGESTAPDSKGGSPRAAQLEQLSQLSTLMARIQRLLDRPPSSDAMEEEEHRLDELSGMLDEIGRMVEAGGTLDQARIDALVRRVDDAEAGSTTIGSKPSPRASRLAERRQREALSARRSARRFVAILGAVGIAALVSIGITYLFPQRVEGFLRTVIAVVFAVAFLVLLNTRHP